MIEYLGDKTPEDVAIAAQELAAKSGRPVEAADILQFAIEGKPTPAIIAAARMMVHMRRLLHAAGII